MTKQHLKGFKDNEKKIDSCCYKVNVKVVSFTYAARKYQDLRKSFISEILKSKGTQNTGSCTQVRWEAGPNLGSFKNSPSPKP